MASSDEVFQVRGSTLDEVKNELNGYLKRLAMRLNDLQGLLAATKQFNDLNMQGKHITNLGDPSANDDAQKKALALSRSSPAGNWDAGGKKITNGVEGTNPTDVVIVRQVQGVVAGEVGTHTHQSTTTGGQLDHGLALTGLTDDDHTQYRLESENHTHQSSGAQAGTLDHGLALTGLTDDDHTQYYLADGTRAISGALDHDGTTVGFYGTAPATQESAQANVTGTAGGATNGAMESIPDPADTPASADALRDDLVANTLPALRNNIDEIRILANKALTVVRDVGLMAT